MNFQQAFIIILLVFRGVLNMIEPSEHRPTQVVIDLDAIRHNIKLFKDDLEAGQQLYATVKADAYGHGAIAIAKTAVEMGVDGLAVATVDEGIELRKNGLKDIPILVMGLTDPRGIAEILYYQLTITVSGSEFFAKAYRQLEDMHLVQLLNQYPLNFHLAIDTGMGRIGLTTKESIAQFVEELLAYTWAHWEGVFTHFSTAGGGPEEYVDYQWQQWMNLLEAVPAEVEVRHYANSAMAMWHKNQPASSIIRLGIALYGIDPKDHVPLDLVPENQIPAGTLTQTSSQLKPALQLISELVYVKKINAGSKVSYGAKYTAEEDEWIGTVPIGYADGWLRHYENISLIIQGQLCPVVGTINMDQLMVRLPGQLDVGTTVTLIGQDGAYVNHASNLAQQLQTISYEIFCTIGNRVARIYLNEQ